MNSTKYAIALSTLLPALAMAATPEPSWVDIHKNRYCTSLGDLAYSTMQKQVAHDKAWFWQKSEKKDDLDKAMRSLRRISPRNPFIQEELAGARRDGAGPEEVESRVISRCMSQEINALVR